MKKKEPVVKMIKIIVSTSDGRSESTIKSPHATRAMVEAAYRAVRAMSAMSGDDE